MWVVGTKIAVGLFLFIVGLKMFGNALKDLANPSWMTAIDNPWMMALIALIITLIVQSSSLTTAMIIGFVSSGLLGLPGAIGGIIGANLGTTLTAWIAAAAFGFEKGAREAAMVHTFLNLTMAIIALPFSRQIALIIGRW